jgi:hypothetical protein
MLTVLCVAILAWLAWSGVEYLRLMHAVIYTLALHETRWRVLRDAQFVAAFSDYETARAFVLDLVETRCQAGKASKVIYEDEHYIVEY